MNSEQKRECGTVIALLVIHDVKKNKKEGSGRNDAFSIALGIVLLREGKNKNILS